MQAYGHGVLEPRRIGAGPSYRSNAEEASGRCVLDVPRYDIPESVPATATPQHKGTDFTGILVLPDNPLVRLTGNVWLGANRDYRSRKPKSISPNPCRKLIGVSAAERAAD
jgi:hypothetical protein